MNHLHQVTIDQSNIPSLDEKKPILVLAPLFEFPIRSGDNILIHNRYSSLSRFVPYVDVVGHNVLVRYNNGKIVSKDFYENAAVSKYIASIKVILKRSHYLVEKYLSKSFQQEACKHLADPAYGGVVFSYIWTIKLLPEPYWSKLTAYKERLHIIETINDEVAWYKNLRAATNNPFAKVTAWLSEKWIQKFLKSLNHEFLFIHLTNADQQSYINYLPNHLGVVAPVGANVDKSAFEKRIQLFSNSHIQLLFVGSLNVQMNFDALSYFSKKFFPHIKKELGEKLQIKIVGKEPTQKVKDLCTKMDWQLFANVTNHQLDDFFSQATFTILPFSYTTGAKLKLLDSIAHGVPFLATTILAHQTKEPIYPCLFSDDPNDWLARINEIGSTQISLEEQFALKQFAYSYSWDVLTLKLFHRLKTLSNER